MADSKITALTALTAADPINDMFPVVDVSDTSMAASGTTKRISVNNILSSSPTASGALTVTGLVTAGSATITGALGAAGLNVTGATIPANGVYLGSANNLSFSYASTLGMTLNSTGLGVGASPANVITARAAQDTGLELNSAASNASRLIFAYDPANTRWYINSTLSGSGTTLPLAFLIGNTERMRIDTSGNVGIGVTPSAGKGCLQLSSGINFPATQVASSDPNTLDDYEEGSWTPVVADASTGGNTGTCTINSAKYVKIGRQVSVQCDISGINTTGMTAGNTFFIRGLPFTTVQGGNGNFYTYRVGRDASTVSSSAFVGDSSSWLFFALYTTNSATTDKTLIVSNIVSTTSQIILSLTYFV